MGAHSGRWEFLANFFLRENISSYAIELRGFGETSGLRGYVDSFNTYLSDIRRLRDIIAGEHPGKKIFIVGESLGGLIAFHAAATMGGFFSGLVAISPAFKGKLKFDVLEYLDIFSSAIFNSRKQFRMRFTASMCTRDFYYQRLLDMDRREHKLATARLLFETALAQIKSPILRNKLKIPTLFLLSGNDSLVDMKASERIFENLKVKNKKIIAYPDMQHALSVETGKEKVFRDMLGWLEED